MPELKRNFTGGKMNKDIDERMVPKGEYVDALNIEIRTSEGANVGTVQTLKGNTAMTGLGTNFDKFSNATCVGTVADNATNKIYWLVADTGINQNASWTETFTTQSGDDGDGSNVEIVHNVYSDYIIEYDETKSGSNAFKFVAVEHYKVETTISNNAHSGNGDHQHISNLSKATTGSFSANDDLRKVGIQPGMTLHTQNTPKTQVIKIEPDNTGTWYGWRVYTEHNGTDTNYGGLDNVAKGTTAIFELPENKRALGFSNFLNHKPTKIITGINIIDDLLFWTDGLTEPKKINIKRCIYGSQQGDPVTYPQGTNIYNTALFTNGIRPDDAITARLSTDSSTTSGAMYPPLTYRETTVIKKSPTTPLTLTMSNTTRGDVINSVTGQVSDGVLVVNSPVTIPFAYDSTTGTYSTTSSDFFFNSNGQRKNFGQETDYLTFPEAMDWNENDIIEFYPGDDDDAGTANKVLVIARITDIINAGTTFKFEIQSISKETVKVVTEYIARLKQEDPLFEFKFPRFAYRWRYEDGEYSTYSPFSEVAFLPEQFDYLPKKGYNLGMTNNLRYLLLSGFKPKTTPLDVVEIDILYKESNSPNVYTVETIKSPSSKNTYLGTDEYEGDPGWFGKIQRGLGFVESPNTLTTTQPNGLSTVLVGTNTLDGNYVIDSGIYYFGVDKDFGDVNMKIGDTAQISTFGSTIITGIKTEVINGDNVSLISLTNGPGGAAITTATVGFTNTAGDAVKIFRKLARKPALYIDNPQGSLEIKSDMIHATVASNQLLRPWDNVPIKALAQEITGNRIVYGNYTQNYNLEDDSGYTVKNIFAIDTTARKNIRDNIRYDDRTSLRDFSTGAVIDWWDNKNNIIPESRMPERSLKSMRDYQVGVVYMDEFGRQTPVQSHESGAFRLPKDKAELYNAFRFHLYNRKPGKQPKKPHWATHYKYYVKENANEYYNMAMDRFYDAQDGNIWLSFPSSERNKVDEETFLILKKQHDADTFVRDDARYKILAIENEAPLFIKTKVDSFGTISIAGWNPGGEPKYQQQFVDIPENLFVNSGAFKDAVASGVKNRVLRVSDVNNVSKFYDVVSIRSHGNYRRATVRKAFGVDMSFTTVDGTNAGAMNQNISIELAVREVKNLPEFSGRFFVKVLRDAVLEKNILSKAEDKVYVTAHTLTFGYMANKNNTKSSWQSFAPSHRFFVSTEDPEDILGYYDGGGEAKYKIGNEFGYHSTLRGIYPQGDAIDFLTWGGADGIDRDFGISRFNNSFNASEGDKAKVACMLRNGQLFRFRGDKTVYRVTAGCYEFRIWTWADGYNKDVPSNHAVGIHMEFEPAIGDMGGIDGSGLDAVGKPIIDNYDIRYGNKEGTDTNGEYGVDSGIQWPSFPNKQWETNYGEDDYNRSIEFLEEFMSDDSYSSDNPAIWETEPKENIDVDIYNEASVGYPIDFEWNSFTNSFVKKYFFNSWNASSYYNCFSFANGVESNRIRDDFNAPTIDKGPKVSTVLAEQYKQENRKSGLIYSGIYNSLSGVNNLNQFIQAEKITKDVSPTYGSIQKLHAKDTNLNILCEDRILGVLADKDALFNADGNTNVIATNRFLGQVTPYVGDFGISTDPESFASDQYRSYFTDKSRGAVIRLSRDGITPISDAGMADYFEEVFKNHSISLIGSYDDDKKLYNLSIKPSALGSDANNLNQTIIVSDQEAAGSNEAEANIVTINTGPTPTAGNALGNWRRYLSVGWARFVEASDDFILYAQNNNTTASSSYSITNYAVTKRAWGGIHPKAPYSYPAGIEYGNVSTDIYSGDNFQPNALGLNPYLNNPLTLYFPVNTTAYAGHPSINSSANWDALILSLNANGPNNVYLYQTSMGAQTNPPYNTHLSLSSNWPNNWPHAHQPETVYSIEEISWNALREVYFVKVNWLVGMGGYDYDNSFVWSETSPFYVDNSGTSSSNTVYASLDENYSDGTASQGAYNDQYINITVSFSEASKGWTTFQSFVQECGVSLNSKYFTFKAGELYQHYDNNTRNSFYGADYDSYICAVFNDMPSSVKSFNSINYEGSRSKVVQNLTDGEYYNNTNVTGWFADLIKTDLEQGFIPEFKEKEGKWFNYIKGNLENNLDNLDVKQFSTQGIGTPSAVSTDESNVTLEGVSTSPARYTLTIKDTGDSD
tara:strand:- start:9123 stop:15566 length:6444 start_codon:yes stop_codon:yes gene_type:complete